VDRLLRNSTVGITTIPYNQAALVRVTSAAVEGLDQIKSSSSRSGTLLTAEVSPTPLPTDVLMRLLLRTSLPPERYKR
jgi:hypothetical protein